MGQKKKDMVNIEAKGALRSALPSQKSKLESLIRRQLDPQDITPLNSYEIRNYIYYGFSEPSLRAMYWKGILGYVTENKFRTEQFLKTERRKYYVVSFRTKDEKEMYADIEKQVEEDIRSMIEGRIKESTESVSENAVQSTAEGKQWKMKLNGLSSEHIGPLKRMLLTFIIEHKRLRYTRNLIPLIFPLYYVLVTSEIQETNKFAEEDAYALFKRLMKDKADYYLDDAEERESNADDGTKNSYKTECDGVKGNDGKENKTEENTSKADDGEEGSIGKKQGGLLKNSATEDYSNKQEGDLKDDDERYAMVTGAGHDITSTSETDATRKYEESDTPALQNTQESNEAPQDEKQATDKSSNNIPALSRLSREVESTGILLTPHEDKAYRERKDDRDSSLDLSSVRSAVVEHKRGTDDLPMEQSYSSEASTATGDTSDSSSISSSRFFDESHVVKKMQKVLDIIKDCDNDLYQALEEKNVDIPRYAARWATNMFALEFELESVLWLWDRFLSDSYKFEMVLYACAASVILFRNVILKASPEKCHRALENLAVLDVEVLFDVADVLRRKKVNTVKLAEESRLSADDM